MILLQSILPTATTAKADTTAAVTGHLAKIDSVNKAVADSLKNIDSIKDIGALVTGDNPLLKDAIGHLINLCVGFLPRLLGAFLVLWIGFQLIKPVKKAMMRLFEKRNAEASLRTFLTSFVEILLKVLLVIMVMDIIGVKATSFIAILGALGLAIGMAMQGTLQNFAGGVIILMQRPFKVGDYIESGNYAGYVTEIRIFNTLIKPFNGRIIVCPNSDLATKSIINHTKEPKIRLTCEVGVAYGTQVDRVKEVLMDVVHVYENTTSAKDGKPLVLKEDKPATVCVTELGSSAVKYTIWMWCTVANYWTVWERMNEDVYNALNAAHIEIPFPQVQVHTKQ